MAISSVNAQTFVPIPGQGQRDDVKLPEDASAARTTGIGGESAATAAIDKRSVAVNAQKTDTSKENSTDKNHEPDAKTLTDALERVKNFVQSAASDVQFSVDESSGIRIVKVVDKETKEVIRQMPSKEVVELAKALDKLQGLMIKQTA